jgi:hypothetical protein
MKDTHTAFAVWVDVDTATAGFVYIRVTGPTSRLSAKASDSAPNFQLITRRIINMADSAPKVAAKEHREAASAVDEKATALVKQINQSKHFIAFTGAGISTSAGIF